MSEQGNRPAHTSAGGKTWLDDWQSTGAPAGSTAGYQGKPWLDDWSA